MNAYVPRIILRHLAADPGVRAWTVDGTVAFVDISGFTKLSERLAKAGREGAEQITEAIGGSFEAILSVAYMNGGGLIKFGGDALLLLFEGEGHLERAAAGHRADAPDPARRRPDRGPGAKVNLRMSQGLHTGRFHFFLVGEVHRELLPIGPAWSRTVAMEHDADAGEILISPEAAALLPARCLGATKGQGVLLKREPSIGKRSRSPTRRSSYRRTWSPSVFPPPCARTSRPAAAHRNIAR